jgi:hypothetical protein
MSQRQAFHLREIDAALTWIYGAGVRRKFSRMVSERLFPRVGRGGLVRYTRTHVRQTIVGVELNELGLTFPSIARLFRSNWKTINEFCDRAERADREGKPDVLLFVRGRRKDAEMPSIGIITIDEMHLIKQALAREADPPRFSATNLTAQLKRMSEALERVERRPHPRGVSKRKSVSIESLAATAT